MKDLDNFSKTIDSAALVLSFCVQELVISPLIEAMDSIPPIARFAISMIFIVIGYILLEKMLRKHADDLVPSVKDIVKPEYTDFFQKRGALESVRYDSYGKPYFDGHENASFNLSHSGYMVACALITAPEGEIASQVGVDIERVRIDTVRAERVADRYFNDAEKALLAPVAADPEAYCRLFTRIEYRKTACGKDVSVNKPFKTDFVVLAFHKDCL
jgi:hypothetical protein